MTSERLRALRKKNKMTQNDLAARLHVSQQAVAKWEAGAAYPEKPLLVRLAQMYCVSTDYLLGAEEYTAPATAGRGVMVPVVGEVRAGFGALAVEDYDECLLADVRDPQMYFYLTVRGDSMHPYIREGDLALVRRQPTLENGDLGVFIYGDGEGTLKRLRRHGATVILQPLNSLYEPLVLEGEDLEGLRIVGKVVETRTRWE